MIPFNKPPVVGGETELIAMAIKAHKICGDGEFTKRCSNYLEKITGCCRALLTTSCTSAIEMAALLLDIKEGDEVIMPSYTFVSTANPFVLRGAKIVFVDIRPDTMNIDEGCIEAAITSKTRAIVPVHYAGVACEMEEIMAIAQKYNLAVVEDAAQGIMADYKGNPLGTFGEFGCFSFHETKNISCGEGGAILINNPEYIQRSEIIREKGTNRSKFWRGEVDKYTWCDMGSSYLPSELNAAYLMAQLEKAEDVTRDRQANWQRYYSALKQLWQSGCIELPFVPQGCNHNGHMFYIKCKDIKERTQLIEFLKQRGIYSVFHYIPLHSSPAGKAFGRLGGEDKHTTKESERLLRLPLYYGLTKIEINTVIKGVLEYYAR